MLITIDRGLQRALTGFSAFLAANEPVTRLNCERLTFTQMNMRLHVTGHSRHVQKSTVLHLTN